ncbi:hypothetical protein JOE21_001272 [Desmospora profundinema]|uniref:Sulfotransferase domain-containing protein n=1 Tax=Desmospora profundinema TaxID=1571184 RepID=A0ABU1IKI5_9BACL|nr:hypothetical protein [Desmospora profundinema]
MVAELVKKLGFYMGVAESRNPDRLKKNDNKLLNGKDFKRIPQKRHRILLRQCEKKMLHSKKIDYASYVGWGFKNPTTHLYLKSLKEYFDSLKYILVIRNGLDMAYSNNRRQLYYWGSRFHIDIPENRKYLPVAQLDYWIKANRRAIHEGKKLLGNRFLVIHYDRLCVNPKKEIKRLAHFLGLDLEKMNIDSLADIIRKPESFERYKKQDLSIFNKKHFRAVRRLGFVVNKTK